jgi:hypothetical protein
LSSNGWRAFPYSRAAGRVTIVLLVLQLGGCAFDFTCGQLSLMSAICLVTSNPVLSLVGAVLWLILALSWLVGLLSVGIPSIRPLYWGLLFLIPFAYAGQLILLQQGVLGCDGP